MRILSDIGRIFYGIAIAGMGFQTIYDHDLPYMLIPPTHFRETVLVVFAYMSGTMFILAGSCIALRIKPKAISLLLGTVLLAVFCFYFIPYEFLASANYMHLGEWENAEKELALSGGALVIAGCFSGKGENPLFGFLNKLIPYGAILFSITIISFGIDHFLYAKGAAEYVPSWVPNHLFWIYLGGIGLIGSGIAIMFSIKPELFAFLLGAMIMIWFSILHIPKVILSSPADRPGEMTSAFLALAYSGIAFVIAGVSKKQKSSQRWGEIF